MISATNYVISSKEVLIIKSVIEFIKCNSVWYEAKEDCFEEVISNFKLLKEAKQVSKYSIIKKKRSCEPLKQLSREKNLRSFPKQARKIFRCINSGRLFLK